MKSILILFTICLTSITLWGQIDRSHQPQPGPAPFIQLGNPVEFHLDNGLTVLMVENHKLPRVSVSLRIDYPLIKEGENTGALDLLTQMMEKGTQTVSKNDFEEEIDFMGAHFHFNTDGAHASSLTRYFPRLLEMLADAALHPRFTEAEFQKEKNKLITALETGEKDVKSTARRVENLLAYGPSHPFGEYLRKEKISKLTLHAVQNAYDYVFNSDRAYLIVVGDFDPKSTKKQIKKLFEDWEGSERTAPAFPEPNNPTQTEIAFISMPNAVQSEIAVFNTVTLTKNSPDYYAALLANQILGGGGEARLFLNLREDKGFTYGAYSRLSDSNKTKGLFKATTSVRNAVTDSAVVELLSEIEKIRINPVSNQELDLVKAKYSGNFILTLEDPETVANFAYNIKTQNLPPDYYKTLLKQINRVTKEEIMAATQKYFLSDHAQIVVTGNGEVLENLEQLEFKGKPLPLRYFDQWGAEIQRPDYSNSIPEGMTAARVVNNYLETLGEMSKLRELRTYKEIAKAEMQGMALEVVSHKTNQKQSLTELKVRGSVMQKQVVNKDYAYLEMQGQKIDLEGAVFNQMTTGAAIIPELNFDFETIELKGIREIDGKKAYEIKVAEGLSYFYDTERFLKIQISQTMELMGSSQTTITKLGAYKEVEGILFPHQTTLSMGPQEINFELELIELNKAIDPQIFK